MYPRFKYQPKHLTPDQGQSQPGLSSAGCKKLFLSQELKSTLCKDQYRNGKCHQFMFQSCKQNTRSLFLQQTKDASGFRHFVLESNSMNENVRILATKTVHAHKENPQCSKEPIITVTSNPVLEDATTLLCPALSHR